MRPSSTARRYAEAAFEVARAHDAAREWIRDLRTALKVMEGTGFDEYFRDPSVGVQQRLDTINDGFSGKIGPHVLNLLRILTTKERLHLLAQLLREFEDLDREARGIAEAHVVVSRPVDNQEKLKIAEQLAQTIGKRVEVFLEVDPSILGGIVVRIGDRLVDASVSGNLRRLRQVIA
jgi:F-type H+-transporting ATPase subunit delta